MGYAPVSTIYTGPTPADSGTVVVVQPDAGDRFPPTPFRYLAWPVQTIPNLGVDSEEGICLTVTRDTLTLDRPEDPCSMTAGMAFAALNTTVLYDIEEQVSLAQEFPATDTHVALQLRAPSGAVGRYTDALVESVGPSGGSEYTLAFEANESGMWEFKFTSDQRVFPEDDFYVRFTDVY